MITFESLSSYREITHFCTTREGGFSQENYASFNLSPYSGDNPEHIALNQHTLCQKLGLAPENLLIPFQAHGIEVRKIDGAFFEQSQAERNTCLHGVDALITDLQHVCIGVTTADCVPVLFFDPVRRAVAVAHAGWRGTCGRIAEKTVEALVQSYHTDPQDVRVVIGPSISADVYEVGAEVVGLFRDANFNVSEIVVRQNNSFYLDLWKANQLSLLEAGIQPSHIEISGICSFTEHTRCFSARRLGIKSGRMLSGIMIRS
ncbi:MAG TPA: peptidoglycan editing factor PgeF [Paludibacter sp.]|nr:peptidoglycan editing factor PgeF [Paludibacter sp.]